MEVLESLTLTLILTLTLTLTLTLIVFPDMEVLERIEKLLETQDWSHDSDVAALRVLGAVCAQIGGICASDGAVKAEAEIVLRRVAQQCVDGLVAQGKARSMMATRTVKSILRSLSMPDDVLDIVFEEPNHDPNP